jgi:hypothetical protein
MTVPTALDAAGRRPSPRDLAGLPRRSPARNKGQLYPADPSTVEEIIAVMRELPTIATAPACGR